MEIGRAAPAAPAIHSDAKPSQRRFEHPNVKKFENHVAEAFAETMLNGGVGGGGNGVTIDYQKTGGPKRVILTGSTFSQTLFKNDVRMMLDTGNFSMLDPAIPSALSGAGISSLDFVEALDEMF